LAVPRSATEGKAGTQQTFDLGVVGIRAPRTDPLSRHVASELVERKRDPEALFAGHPSVHGDLFLERSARVHREILLLTSDGRTQRLLSDGLEKVGYPFDLEPAPRLELGTC